MFTGTAEELRARETQARELAEQAAALLDQIDALGLGAGGGQLHTPGGIIRNRPGQGWTVATR
ncbi:hypothetical protein [Streptomyces antarcticus]|uniref:hypothetical protein n=1 Tax=Streptomyces antarcticus TaxID=2996458 RepID=UPI0022721ED4|nr:MULTISPECIES: hypothetical protein [unclassified Streptomyces]MCY0947798.1 hypothetical protein [Streptomyces sp. H34-AA3]MCZ4088343.1 hypothetical protein [Streptomyces sp. H34-S5]